MNLSDDECYTRLRAAIVSGELHPQERLIEMDLAQSLGAGRAAVRTALTRLEQEGLVQHERYRGARVRLVSEAEAIEILESRAALESLIVRHAALKATDDDIVELRAHLAEMRQLLDAGDLLGYSERNAHLHRALVRIAQHATASRLLDMLNSQNVRFQYRTILIPGRQEHSYREHTAIVEAVAQHDAERAQAAMHNHLLQVAEALRTTKETGAATK